MNSWRHLFTVWCALDVLQLQALAQLVSFCAFCAGEIYHDRRLLFAESVSELMSAMAELCVQLSAWGQR